MEERLNALFSRLRFLSPIALAYSGGLDSRFLALCAEKAGASFTLFHFSGAHVSEAETAYAAAWAQKRHYPLQIVATAVLGAPEVAANSKERCYWCKRRLFLELKRLAGGRAVCDGTNASDQIAFRPGLRALRELGIVSPLALAGLAKEDIRSAGRTLGLEAWDQKARPCLLTRFPYGRPVSEEALKAIGRLEEAADECLKEYRRGAPPDCRLRVVEDGRLEVHIAGQADGQENLENALRQRLAAACAECGVGLFDAATLRIVFMERVSGYHDRVPERRDAPVEIL